MGRNINIKLGKNKNLILNTDFPFRIHFCEDEHVDLINDILNTSKVDNKSLASYNLIFNVIDLNSYLVKDSNINKLNDFFNTNSITPYQINYFVSINNYDKCNNTIISSLSNICIIIDNSTQDLSKLYSEKNILESPYIIEELNKSIYKMDCNSDTNLNVERIHIDSYTIPFNNFKNFIEKKIIYWLKINESNDNNLIKIEKIDLTNEYDECAECELRIFCNGIHRDNNDYCVEAIRFFKDSTLELIDKIY